MINYRILVFMCIVYVDTDTFHLRVPLSFIGRKVLLTILEVPLSMVRYCWSSKFSPSTSSVSLISSKGWERKRNGFSTVPLSSFTKYDDERYSTVTEWETKTIFCRTHVPLTPFHFFFSLFNLRVVRPKVSSVHNFQLSPHHPKHNVFGLIKFSSCIVDVRNRTHRPILVPSGYCSVSRGY